MLRQLSFAPFLNVELEIGATISGILFLGIAMCIVVTTLASDESPTEGVIICQITDSNQHPLAGCSVSARIRTFAHEGAWPEWKEIDIVKECYKGGQLRMSLLGGDYLFRFSQKQYADTMLKVKVSPGNVAEIHVVLKEGVEREVSLTDVHGVPIVGARVREIEQRGSCGQVYLSQRELRQLEFSFPESDANGEMRLPRIPIGDSLDVVIEHSMFSPTVVRVPGESNSNKLAKTMASGGRIKFRFDEDGIGLENVMLRLVFEEFNSPSTITDYVFTMPSCDSVGITVQPGEYTACSLYHPEYNLTRIESGSVRVEADSDVTLSFAVAPKVRGTGRVVTTDGRPVSNVVVVGEVANASGKSDDAEWSIVDHAITNEVGQYRLLLSAGEARVSIVSAVGFIPLAEPRVFDIRSGDCPEVDDIVIESIPRVKGRVVLGNESPASHCVVRLRGKDLGAAQPILTDVNGEFDFQPEAIPFVIEDGGRKYRWHHHIVAFHPYQALEARCDIDLRSPDPIILTLESHDPMWLMRAFEDEISDWEFGLMTQEEIEKLKAFSLIGHSPPQLEGGPWINTQGKSIQTEDLLGRFVLLCFWFKGCGPCHREFPSVQLCHRLYGSGQVSVISVHANTASFEEVRSHSEQNGLSFPIMMDTMDGRTVNRYAQHHISDIFPAYLVLDRDGKVIFDDRTSIHPRLRVFKLEIVRALLLGAKIDEIRAIGRKVLK